MRKDLHLGASLPAVLAVERVPGIPASGALATRHLNQSDLARRWRVSERTLEGWRWRKVGPPYLKVSGHVLYRLQDILDYEIVKLQLPISDPFFQRAR